MVRLGKVGVLVRPSSEGFAQPVYQPTNTLGRKPPEILSSVVSNRWLWLDMHVTFYQHELQARRLFVLAVCKGPITRFFDFGVIVCVGGVWLVLVGTGSSYGNAPIAPRSHKNGDSS